MLQWHQAAVDEALVNPVVVRRTTSLLGVILVARTSLDQAQGLGGGKHVKGVPCAIEWIQRHVAVTRSLKSCTASSFGVDDSFGPRRPASYLPKHERVGTPAPSSAHGRTGVGSWKFEGRLLIGLDLFWNGSPRSMGEAGELEGALAHAMYQGVCAGLQG